MKFVQVPVPMFWFGTSSQNIIKIIKGSNLSYQTSYDKSHNLSRRFIYFGQQYERNIYGKGFCHLPIATSRLCDKSKKYVLDNAEEIEFLGLIVNFQTMTVITSGKDREDKGSMPMVIQGIRGITSRFDKTYRNTLSNHSGSALSPSTVFLLTTTTNCVSNTNIVLLHFGKADSMAKNELLWWLNNLGLCWANCLYNNRPRSLLRQMHPTKAGEQFLNESEQEVSSSRRNKIYISISWKF